MNKIKKAWKEFLCWHYWITYDIDPYTKKINAWICSRCGKIVYKDDIK